MLDGESALVVFDICVETSHVFWIWLDFFACIASEDYFVESVCQAELLGVVNLVGRE